MNKKQVSKVVDNAIARNNGQFIALTAEDILSGEATPEICELRKHIWPASLSEEEDKLYSALLSNVYGKGGFLYHIDDSSLKEILKTETGDLDERISAVSLKFNRMYLCSNSMKSSGYTKVFGTIARSEGYTIIEVSPSFKTAIHEMYQLFQETGTWLDEYILSE